MMNIRQLVTRRSLFHSAKKKISDFSNNKEINETFVKYKSTMDSETFSLLKNFMKSEKKIHMFEISDVTKIFFIFTRFQLMFYGIGTCGFSIYTLITKYSTLAKRSGDIARIKRRKLIAFAVGAITTSFLGLSLTFKMGRRIVKSIHYLPQENKFEINFFSLFCRNKCLIIDESNLVKIEGKKKFDSSVEMRILNNKKYNFISTKGTGLFLNRKFFEYMIEQNIKKSA